MSEKTNILYLCVLIAISDYELQNEETHKIIKISKELKIRLLRLQAMQKASEQLIILPKLGEIRFVRGEDNSNIDIRWIENYSSTNVQLGITSSVAQYVKKSETVI